MTAAQQEQQHFQGVEQWAVSLRNFIHGSLIEDARARSVCRTTVAATATAATGSNPTSVTTTASPMSLGRVLGIVWAIEDASDFWSASWTTLKNELKAACPIGSSAAYIAQEGAPAAYAIWCIIDAIVKTTRLSDLRKACERDIPNLVAHHFPILVPVSIEAKGVVVQDATSWTPLFLDFLRGWAAQSVLSPECTRRIEQQIKYRLEHPSLAGTPLDSARRGALAVMQSGVRSNAPTTAGDAYGTTTVKVEGEVKVEPGTSAASLAAVTEKARAIARVVSALRAAATASGTGGTSTIGAGGPPNVYGDAAVLSFVEELNHRERTEHCCRHCGAYFNNAAAKANHTRVHFDYALLAKDGLYRMPPLTDEAFVRGAVPDRITDGTYPVNFGTASVVSRAARGAGSNLKRQRGTEASASAAASEQQQSVPIANPMESFHCCRCRLRIVPELGGGGSWVLPGCTTVDEGFAHVACLE